MGFIVSKEKGGIRFMLTMSEETKKRVAAYREKHPELTIMEAINQMPSKDEEVKQSPSEIRE